jgi:hypothetical protein
MSQQPLDAQREAHDALGTAVSSYGHRVLSDPHILGNLVADLLPDLPRERSLLVAGAEAGIAAQITQHVEEQHIDPDTAVQLVARALSERRAIDPGASTWVAAEYAQALGYRVRPYPEAATAPALPPQVIPAAPPTRTALGGQPPPWQTAQDPQAPRGPAQSWPPAQPPAPSWAQTQQPAPSWAQTQQPAPSWAQTQQPAQSWPPTQGPGQQPGQSWPPAQQPSGRPPTTWTARKRGLIAAGTAAGVVVAYLVVAAVTHTVPFARTHPVAAPSPGHTPHVTPTHPRTPTPSPTPTGPALAAGVAPLTQLLPQDLDDPATQCQPIRPPYHWTMPGLVEALSCTDPGLPNGNIYAFQVDSYPNFVTTWKNYNKWWGISALSPGPNCPPASGGAGTIGFHNNFFKQRSGQVLECETVTGSSGGNEPAYTWAYPTQDAFIVAQGAAGSSFSALDSWWTNNSAPLNSPSPSAS